MKKLCILCLCVFLVSCSDTTNVEENIADTADEVENIEAQVVANEGEEMEEIAEALEELTEVQEDVGMYSLMSYSPDLDVEIIDCTLSDGTDSECYEVTSVGTPDDHALGPWCPSTIMDGAEEGGLWFKDGEMYNVDGSFIENLPTLYDDQNWLLHDEAGNVFKTESKDECLQLAGAQLVDEFTNYCIECLPEYVADMETTYVIPVSPQLKEQETTTGGQGRERPESRGIALNGTKFDAEAPLQIILAGYTIPPLDYAGGHINMDSGYHYHAATGKTREIAQDDGHAPLIGIAMDGFYIYAHNNEAGEEETDIDSCRGHSDDERGYHYHVDAAGNNNFIDCLSGVTGE